MEPQGTIISTPRLEYTSSLDSIPESATGVCSSPQDDSRRNSGSVSPDYWPSGSGPGTPGSPNGSIPQNVSKGGSLEPKELRILVLGCSGVGKSALVVRYLTKRFIGDYAPHETMCSCQVVLDYKRFKLSILDTSWNSCNKNDSSRMEYFLDWCDGILLVFSLVDRTTFTDLELLRREIVRWNRGKEHIPLLLVGNKADLSHLRVVTSAEAASFAEDIKCSYVETSASESYQTVLDAFTLIAQEIRKVRRSKQRRPTRKSAYSKLFQLRDTLRSIAGEFRQRTNTF